MNRATVVSIQEVGAVNTLSVHDFTGGGAPHVCSLCGLAPSSVSVNGRPDPMPTLLEIAGVDEHDPLHRSIYRCRNREMCERRKAFRSRQA